MQKAKLPDFIQGSSLYDVTQFSVIYDTPQIHNFHFFGTKDSAVSSQNPWNAHQLKGRDIIYR